VPSFACSVASLSQFPDHYLPGCHCLHIDNLADYQLGKGRSIKAMFQASTTNQPINTPTNKPINQSTQKPINQSTNQQVNKSTNEPMNQ